MRRRNLARLLEILRLEGRQSRPELASLSGLSLPSVHRLAADLMRLGLVEEATDTAPRDTRAGRPPVWLRFRDDAARLAGVDVGSETTRVALATLDGRIEQTTSIPTADIGDDLTGGLVHTIRQLHAHPRKQPLVAVGVGVPSVVDADGVLTRPWIRGDWTGLPLAEQLSGTLGCSATVAQDNHLSALAENSAEGTAPHARSVVVLEVGVGVGAGLVLDGEVISGSTGGLGRLAKWPYPAPARAKELGSSLGELLVADSLVRQYTARGGHASLRDAVELFASAADGDRTARAVVRWAGTCLGDTILRIGLLLDPAVVVIGGGLGSSFAQLEPHLEKPLAVMAVPPEIRQSVLGTEAVALGGIIAAERYVPGWLADRLD